MNLSDVKYIKAFDFIQERYEEGDDWTTIREAKMFQLEESMLAQVLATVTRIPQEEFTLDLWRELVDYKRKLIEDKNITKLGKDILNDAKIPSENNSTWQLYKQKLVDQNWSFKSIQEIEDSSYDLLRRLSMDTTKDEAIKGLVVGNVQSGKTANMAGLMAMAADNGFNYFIILSGMIENLRKQTAKRIYSDMKTTGDMNLHWHQIEQPTLRSNRPEHDISTFDLSENSKNRYFTVALKNVSRLTNLINWLHSDAQKAKQLKILVIDDEADQASINTQSILDEEYTRINELIRTLANSKNFKAMNYIAYTATPYANILNETSPDSLYPKDFIYLLEESEDYIGPKQLFNQEDPYSVAPIPIVRGISDEELVIVNDIHEGEGTRGLPESFRNAVHWFIITVAVQRYLNYEKPVTMLIHTSFRVNHHNLIANQVRDYLFLFKNNFKQYIHEVKELYENETLDFNREHFLSSMPNYSTPDLVPEFPKWEEIYPYIERMTRLYDSEYVDSIRINDEGSLRFHKGFHLVIDNSEQNSNDEMVRLVYPSSKVNPAPAFIVIGGNTLSRGLTLEGLTTTYFLRNTKQADTLMQMARWFGYRKGYEILPRVWMDHNALQRFEFLNQMNEELRDEIRSYAENGSSPTEYAPKVKNSIDYELIRITSKGKMQSANPTEFDFSGFNSQTTYFENNKADLIHNYHLTMDFLNSLERPEINRSWMIWRDVNLSDVRLFLEGYKICKDVIKLTQLSSLLTWLEEQAMDIQSWNIVYSSVGQIVGTENIDSDWKIHGYSPEPSKRSKLKVGSTDKIANIGALRSPNDLLADVKELTNEEKKEVKINEIKAIRRKHGYHSIPQLIIYRIDKGNDLNSKYHKDLSSGRLPLNFDHDIIGINIMIPGETRGGSHSTHVSAKPIVKEDSEENYHKEY